MRATFGLRKLVAELQSTKMSIGRLLMEPRKHIISFISMLVMAWSGYRGAGFGSGSSNIGGHS